MGYDYGDPARGESFEDANFRKSLVGMGCDVTHFDFMEHQRLVGRKRMREELLAVAANGHYDVVFFFLFTDEIDEQSIRACANITGAPTVNWFADDHWRFEGFSRRYAKALDWSVTTDSEALEKYEREGISGVILSQWACNKYVYHPTDIGESHDVTFVGQPHADRPQVIEALRTAGVPVRCWGSGWPDGRLSTDAMVEVFGSSAVNLNLANSSHPRSLRSALARVLRRSPGSAGRPKQIKGRTFEIPGCAGFQLTEAVPHLERYFDIGREIAIYESLDDLIIQAQHWLNHPTERQAIAKAGYERVMRDHTYDVRFSEIFRTMGLQSFSLKTASDSLA